MAKPNTNGGHTKRCALRFCPRTMALIRVWPIHPLAAILWPSFPPAGGIYNQKLFKMKPKKLSNYLRFCISNRFPALIVGSPGIGKSDIVGQAAEDVEADLIISHPAISDPTDYKGLPFPMGDVAEFLPYGDLNYLIRAKKRTVFFIDDLGQAPISVQAACMQLILARRVNSHIISDHVTFVAATNRREDKAGVTGLLEPVKSRFMSIIDVEVDVEDWIQWAINNNMPAELIAFVRFKPDILTQFQPSKDMTNSPSPRTIAAVGKLLNAGLPKEFEFEAFRGAAGEEFAIEYLAFTDIYKELPSISEIICNPEKAPIPQKHSVQIAVTSALSRQMTSGNINQICKYLERLPVEYAVSCLKDSSVRNKEICESATFIKWASKHASLIM